ncbi:hypothetical protein HK101_010802 [Irineochytrium annulatum]|nr:hypothetical protein HK101_010802 [Irineochytrium annulatum]
MQRRLISNVREVLEIEKKELTRRENERKADEYQLASLNTVSFSALAAKINGNMAQKVESLKRSIETTRLAEAKVKAQTQATSERLLKAITEIADLEERNKELGSHRKTLRKLLDAAFEDDKEDESIRLQISSTKANYMAATDEYDRHLAADAELQMAQKFIDAATLILRVISDQPHAQEEWIVARFIHECKDLHRRADICVQNAFAYDPTLPPHQDTPLPRLSDKVEGALAKTGARLDQVHQSRNWLFACGETLGPRITALEGELKETRGRLSERRVRVVECWLEVLGRGRGAAVDWAVLLPVRMEDVGGARPTPQPVRVIHSVPTVSAGEGLPMYTP